LLQLTPADATKLLADFEASNGKYELLTAALDKHVDSGRTALRALISLRLVLRDYKVPPTELVDAVKESFNIDGDGSILVNLVESPALQKSTKAIELRTSHERILTDSRIVSDIRPVFPDGEVGERIEAAMVNHTLRLSYRATEGDPQDLYIALDTDDLKRLHKQIERALVKESAAREFIESADAIVLEPLEAEEQ